jgi:hypothetical protein
LPVKPRDRCGLPGIKHVPLIVHYLRSPADFFKLVWENRKKYSVRQRKVPAHPAPLSR